MILVRSVLHGKFGTGGDLAAAVVDGMKKMQASGVGSQGSSWRVLTDLSGTFDSVVIEGTAENLGEWQRMRDEMFASPEFGESMRSTYELVASGHQDFYNIEGEGSS
jgi:hypothetical protein